MTDLLDKLLHGDVLFLVIAGAIAITAIVFGRISCMVKTVARERTRREIAAYIAEGSISPEQGERLLKAGEPKDA